MPKRPLTSKIRCPKCRAIGDKVIDSRGDATGRFIRRRRQCVKCSHRYTTYESLDTSLIVSQKSANFLRQLGTILRTGTTLIDAEIKNNTETAVETATGRKP